jgi:hypothetical protein
MGMASISKRKQPDWRSIRAFITLDVFSFWRDILLVTIPLGSFFLYSDNLIAACVRFKLVPLLLLMEQAFIYYEGFCRVLLDILMFCMFSMFSLFCYFMISPILTTLISVDLCN